MRSRRLIAVLSVAAAASLALSACSSSSKSASPGSSSTGSSSTAGSSSSASGNLPTLKLGIMVDTTGVAASGSALNETGIKAYITKVNAAGGVNGQKLSYVLSDTTSTPAGALLSAQEMVQNDKVFAVIQLSSFFFGAEPYLLQQGIPVIGTGFDGPEWTVKSNTNLFDSTGASNPSNVYTTEGQIFKSLGATTCGSLGYSASPSATASATSAVKSCVTQGLKNGYLNQVAFGSTDMAPIALAMKNAGVDAISLSVLPTSGFALAAALRQVGLTPKAFLLLDGYGGDLLADKAAVTAAQGFEFSVTSEPVEMNTAATQAEVKAMAAVGETNTPSSAELNGYTNMAAFVRGLQASGPNPTRAKYMTALRGVTDFDDDGLLAPEKISFSNYDPQQSCSWIVKLDGTKFVPLPNLPFCGKQVSS
jgi:branched-chain amino acid transport system substrate-binding protein